MEDEEKRKEVDIISVAESIDFAVLESVNLDEDIGKLTDRVEGAIRQSDRCRVLSPEEITRVAKMFAGMTADCQHVLGIGNETFFTVNDEEEALFRQNTSGGLIIVDIPALDILDIVEALKVGDEEWVEWLLASTVGHEVFHTHIIRNFRAVAIATDKANRDPEGAHKNDPGEKACNVFGERYADWREENRGQA